MAIRTEGDLLSARQSARAVAITLGFSPKDIKSIITALSELARNILLYAGDGEVLVEAITYNARRGIAVEARDSGPGIPDVEKATPDGFSTSGGLGLGLPRFRGNQGARGEEGRGTDFTFELPLPQGSREGAEE
jgi:serine/threonine-protein kinase RsbT